MYQYIGCPLVGDTNLYIRKEEDVEKDEVLDTLITVTENHVQSVFLYEIYTRLFKDKFYSNAYNFAQIVENMQLTTAEYNDQLEKLTNLGIIVELEERVYKLADGIKITEGSNEKVRDR